ncbi:unnamed protein product [Microthlaspi erraticum]|uniref:RING-type E3 ubiquitin transferase n=1 Tax=Microthlaspi erraticum TaxID=1685480 RepID=A0A6D2IV43_9BRAS|nr:unnamed protein product [Microthlaspi erraticum]
METEVIKVDIKARATPHAAPSSSGFLNTVAITQTREVEEFALYESDGTVSSLGSYPDHSFRDPLPPFMDFENFTPDYVFQRVNGYLHDRVLSGLVTDRILVESQRRDLPQGGLLFIAVSVKLTQKVYLAVPSSISPDQESEGESEYFETSSVLSTTTTDDSDQESQEVETEDLEAESCAICLEKLSESETNPICKLPGCTHEFHEECVIKWLGRQHDSCPLCRQSVDGNRSQAMEN